MGRPPAFRALFTALILLTLSATAIPAGADARKPVPAGNGARNRFNAAPPAAKRRPAAKPRLTDAKKPLAQRTGFVPAAAGKGVTGQYIVTLRPTADLQKRGRAPMAGDLAARYHGKVGHVYQGVSGFDVRMTDAQARLLAQDPAVERVEQNQKAALEDDTYTVQNPLNWGLDRIDQRDRPLSYSYSFATDGNTRKIYVIDSGIARAHKEFQFGTSSRVTFGTNTTGDGKDTDCNGHGTAVASVAAGNNVGAAEAAAIVDVKVVGCADDSGSTLTLMRGVDWVTQNAPKGSYVNMSVTVPRSSELDDAVSASIAKGITYVVAAGNQDEDACNRSPAATPGTITVGASTRNDARVTGTNVGGCINLFAPGENMLVADYENLSGYTSKSGTSFAAPLVTGAAALTPAGLSPADVRGKLIADASEDRLTDIGAGSPNQLLYMGAESRKTCTLTTKKVTSVERDTAHTNMFYNYAHQNDGWTGGDGTYSLGGLYGHGRLWIFSDTFFPPVNSDDTRPRSAPMINNSIVEETSSGLTTHYQGTKAAPVPNMPPAESDTWFWAGAPHNSKGDLQIIYQKYRRFGSGQWDWGWDSNVLADFKNDNLTAPIWLKRMPSEHGIAWGTSIRETEDVNEPYTYIYGVEDVHTGPVDDPTGVYKYLHIARVPGRDLSDTGSWQYLDEHGDWMPSEEWSARQMIAGTGNYLPVSNEFSVSTLDEDYLVTQDSSEAFSGKIMLYSGCSPSGPFGAPTQLWTTTEGGPWGDYGNGNVFTYNAKSHDSLSSGAFRFGATLTISYNINSMNPDDLYADIKLYQPRFIKVEVSDP
ncbi:hypothetical protein GCM10023196_043780 [Actinoallomurus vinaceus]|uniref:Peptidase S8/S53 domain-containing protein n=1 Tax=Actinoallomurus vinaceus TaxID=1080074 RepID=A0ABP8UD25_9ACTN